MEYTMDENMTGCDTLICSIIDEHMPGLCPEKGVPRPKIIEGKTHCGLGPKNGHYGDGEWVECLNKKAKTWKAHAHDRTMDSFKMTLGVKPETQILLPAKDPISWYQEDSLPS